MHQALRMARIIIWYFCAASLLLTQVGLFGGNDTALLKAAGSGKTSKVQELLVRGADVNAQDRSGVTPLMLATFGGHLDTVRLLLEKGAKVDVQEQHGATALMMAASLGLAPIVQDLTARGANVNMQNRQGWTALMIAVKGGHVDVAKVLLDAGADPNVSNHENKTASMLVEQQYRSVMVPLLGQTAPNVGAQQEPTLSASRRQELQEQPSARQEILQPRPMILSTELGRRVALVIGNADYQEGRLLNPVNDANDISDTLQRLGFKVTRLLNANHRTMEDTIEAFSRELRQGGVGLFYYAGHGIQVDGQNYLLPIRSRINRESDIKYEGVNVNWVLELMNDAGNDMSIVILDACRNNPFASSGRSLSRGLALVQAIRGSLIAYATAPGSVAADGQGRNGVYTKYLLQHIATPGESIEDVFKKVRIDVATETRGQQTPWESSSLVTNFYFAGKVAAN